MPGVYANTSAIVDGQQIDAADVKVPVDALDDALVGFRDGTNAFNQLSFGTVEAKTIAAGQITAITKTRISGDTEGSAVYDELDTITGGVDGDILILRSTSTARFVLVRHNVGNIRLANGTHILLTTPALEIILIYDGVNSVWVQMGQPVAGRNQLANGDMESWHLGSALAPDGWVLTGAGGTVAKRTDVWYEGVASAAITRSGTDVHLSRDAYNDMGAIYIRSKTVTFSAYVHCSVASRARLRVYDGTTTSYSVYHLGDGNWKLLSVTVVVGSGATVLQVGLQVDTGNTGAFIDAAMLCEGYGSTPYSRPSPVVQPVAIVGDIKAKNTTGGTSVATSWNTRVLTTVIADPYSIVSLASNQFTLQPGLYEIEAWGSCFQVTGNTMVIHNDTDSTTPIIGENGWNNSADTQLYPMHCIGLVSISAAKAFTVRHYMTGAVVGGLGFANNINDPDGAARSELYTTVRIRKLI